MLEDLLWLGKDIEGAKLLHCDADNTFQLYCVDDVDSLWLFTRHDQTFPDEDSSGHADSDNVTLCYMLHVKCYFTSSENTIIIWYTPFK